MDNSITVSVPDIGDFADVEIIEVLVHVGDQLGIDDSIITVESDKSSMEIPSPVEGEVTEILVSVRYLSYQLAGHYIDPTEQVTLLEPFD